MRLKDKAKEINERYGNIMVKADKVNKGYCKGLTKAQLEAWGITDVVYSPGVDEWRIHRHWYKGNSKVKIDTVLSPTMAICRHKYSHDREYQKVTFSVRGEGTLSIPLSRMIYVWFNGDIPDGYIIDHIDNDSFNNAPINLRLMTIEKKLAKRFVENPDNWTNQYGKPKGYEKAK